MIKKKKIVKKIIKKEIKLDSLANAVQEKENH